DRCWIKHNFLQQPYFFGVYSITQRAFPPGVCELLHIGLANQTCSSVAPHLGGDSDKPAEEFISRRRTSTPRAGGLSVAWKSKPRSNVCAGLGREGAGASKVEGRCSLSSPVPS